MEAEGEAVRQVSSLTAPDEALAAMPEHTPLKILVQQSPPPSADGSGLSQANGATGAGQSSGHTWYFAATRGSKFSYCGVRQCLQLVQARELKSTSSGELRLKVALNSSSYSCEKLYTARNK